MKLWQNVRNAVRALMANKMRSLLTMLGVIIGVAAVVALIAIGDGASADITSQIEGIGANLVSVVPGQVSMINQGQVQLDKLYYEDYEAIVETGTYYTEIAPVYQTTLRVSYSETTINELVSGVTPEFAVIRSYSTTQGRFINEEDLCSEARVAVLGSQTAVDLFDSLSPLGREIKIEGVTFTVVGVLEPKGALGMASADDVVFVPLETGYARLFGAGSLDDGQRVVSNIMMSASDPDLVDELIGQVTFILRRQHKVSPDEELNFSILSQTDFLDTLNSVTQTLTIFLTAIATISLLVGGIGIMNIMLVSVTERTREIGLRKAVGARKQHIRMQFLVETMLMSVSGGIIGILLGVGVAWLFGSMGWIVAQVSLDSILLAFGFSVAVGLFFGIYPALRASSLQPMVALRYE